MLEKEPFVWEWLADDTEEDTLIYVNGRHVATVTTSQHRSFLAYPGDWMEAYKKKDTEPIGSPFVSGEVGYIARRYVSAAQ